MQVDIAAGRSPAPQNACPALVHPPVDGILRSIVRTIYTGPPFALPAAVALYGSQAATAMGVAYGEQVVDMIQPF